MHVKKDDQVFVLKGKNAGMTGKILDANPESGRVIVEGVNLVTKHKKPRGRNQQGGIISQEAPISGANVMLVCTKCKRPSKTGRQILANGEKVRVCKSCGEVIDTIRQARAK
jgi:large subunit ribosomal protein L24